MRITHRFVDQASGATLERPGLQAALAAARAGEFDVLLVYRIDRLTRSIVGLMDVVAQLDAAGVALRSATEPIDTHGPVGRMLLQLLGIFAEFERSLLIDRIEAGFERKAARGEWLGGRPPYGFALDSAEKTLVPDPAESAIVQTVFAKFADEHLGSTAITRWLNQTGSRTRRNKPWTHQMILRMLHNPVYIGKISHGDDIHDGKHQPIVDDATWERAQALIAQRAAPLTPVRPPNESGYLLSGLVRCRTCSNSYVAVSANGRRDHYRYYNCRTRQTRGADACTGPRIPADQLEDAVIASLLDTYPNHDLITENLAAALTTANANRPQLETQLAAADKQLRVTEAAINRYLAAFETGSMPAHLCAARLDELTTRRDELTRHKTEVAQHLARQPEAPSIEDTQRVAQIVEAAIRTGEPSTTKHMLRELIQQIDIDPDRKAYPTYLLPESQVPEPQAARARGTAVRISEPFVEVPGIEPGSFDVSPGLLRAHLAMPLLGSGDHASLFTVTSPVT